MSPRICTIPRRERRPRRSEREAKGKTKVSGCQSNNSSPSGHFPERGSLGLVRVLSFIFFRGHYANRQSVRRNAEGSVPYGGLYKKYNRPKNNAFFRFIFQSRFLVGTFCIVRRSESAQSLVGNAAPGVPKERPRENRKSAVVSPITPLSGHCPKRARLDLCRVSVSSSSGGHSANRQSV